MRRVVQKRAEDADRRRREGKAQAQTGATEQEKRQSLEERKTDDRERLAREAKVHIDSLPSPNLALFLVALTCAQALALKAYSAVTSRHYVDVIPAVTSSDSAAL